METKSYPDLVIGVTTRHGDSAWLEKNTHNYLNILAEYNVTSVVLAPDAPTVLPGGAVVHPDAAGRLPVVVLDHLDGIIFSGGGDVDPRYFGAELNGAELHSIDLKRDELELHLGRQALEQDLPIFGICRGCQVLNVAAGGSMVQHFDGHRSTSQGTVYHEVQFTPGSHLHGVVGQDALVVNTFHHQGMDRAALAPIFVPAAIASPDTWLVEAYESLHHAWVVGVQWHPERSFELEDGHRRIWESFFEACRQRRAR